MILRLGLAVFACAVLAGAHDLKLSVQRVEPVVIVRALYGGAEPAGNADFEVRGPSNPRLLYQSGRCDPNGAFSFVPDSEGDWNVLIDDGFGHRVETAILVSWGGSSSPAPPAFDWRRLLTGLSWIVGLTGLALWWKTRSAMGQQRP